MEEKPTLAQWSELYHVAEDIKRVRPWAQLRDSDCFLLQLDTGEEEELPVLFSTMGNAGQCFGIGVYPGYEAIGGLMRIMTAKNETERLQTGLEQECMMCYFCDREELDSDDRAVIKQLGLRFRGRGQWVQFRCLHRGYAPQHPDAREVPRLTEYLQHYYMAYLACLEYQRNGRPIRFDEGQVLLRGYSPDDGLWLNFGAPMPNFPKLVRRVQLMDDLIFARLKKEKRTKRQLVADFRYLPCPVRESRDQPLYYPLVYVLVDRQSQMIVDHAMIAPDGIDELFNSLVGYLVKNGRPSSIWVRSEDTAGYLDDLCGKIDVPLKTGGCTALLNDVYRKMGGFFTGGME